VIHYHGLPITPDSAAATVLAGRHAFVSYASPEQLDLAVVLCQSFALDNGAFGAWRSGKPITDWSGFYAWVEDARRRPGFDFAVVPDVIDGDEADNDALADQWPFPRHEAAVVWHMHESVERLARLAREWPRVALGSSGEYAVIGDDRWWWRMADAMNAICDADGLPACKLHGLRMLDQEVFSRLPFASADSTNVGRNIGIDSAWRGTYQPESPRREQAKAWRAVALAQRIEAYNAAPRWVSPGHRERLIA
jgi:hypothetical protein